MIYPPERYAQQLDGKPNLRSTTDHRIVIGITTRNLGLLDHTSVDSASIGAEIAD